MKSVVPSLLAIGLAACGSLDVAKYLAKKGASFHKPVQSWGVDSHVELANRSGSPEMLEYLLKLKKKYKKKYEE